MVAATDGLWDNLHLEELIPLLPTSEDDVKQVGAAAWSSLLVSLLLLVWLLLLGLLVLRSLSQSVVISRHIMQFWLEMNQLTSSFRCVSR